MDLSLLDTGGGELYLIPSLTLRSTFSIMSLVILSFSSYTLGLDTLLFPEFAGHILEKCSILMLTQFPAEMCCCVIGWLVRDGLTLVHPEASGTLQGSL